MTVATFELLRLVNSETSVPLWLQRDYLRLREKFLQETTVVDSTTGYIAAEFMNRQPHIDAHSLKTQASILAWNFAFSFPTHVIGIPNSGLPLTQEVAKHFPWATYTQS